MTAKPNSKAHTTTLSPDQLGKLMSQKEFASISDPDKRKMAVINHMVSVMTDHMHDRTTATEIREVMTQEPTTASPIVVVQPPKIIKP